MNITAATEFKEEGLSLAQLNTDPFSEHVQSYGNPDDDKTLHVRFYIDPVEQTAQSIIAGRRVFADTEFVEIMIPGDKHTIIKRQVFDMDKNRFNQQYSRFKQGMADQTIGTPLSELISLTASKVKEYEFFNIRTVEQLVSVSDSSAAAQKMMGFQTDKQKASAFLEIAKGAAPVNELRQRLEERDGAIEIMQRQLADMNAKLEAATARAAVKAK